MTIVCDLALVIEWDSCGTRAPPLSPQWRVGLKGPRLVQVEIIVLYSLMANYLLRKLSRTKAKD